MYVSVTRVDTSAQPTGSAVIVAEEMLLWLREIEGFDGLLILSRAGTTLSFSR